ncbi:hypothetical protein BN903_318 [Halorubrum sp. AJ67]|nr:hypothetical protein BN903_318 [Halorubrum sp. AJ67]
MGDRDSTDIFEEREFLAKIQANYHTTIEALAEQGEPLSVVGGNHAEEIVTDAIMDAIADADSISL